MAGLLEDEEEEEDKSLSNDQNDADDITQAFQQLELTGQVGGPSISPPFTALSPITGNSAEDGKAMEDEEFVNMAMVDFLITLSEDSGLGLAWTPSRRPFLVRNASVRKVYEARVDGTLRQSDGEVRAIVEVKPFNRQRRPETIRMQEAAQMAAWISQHPPARQDKDTTKQPGYTFK